MCCKICSPAVDFVYVCLAGCNPFAAAFPRIPENMHVEAKPSFMQHKRKLLIVESLAKREMLFDVRIVAVLVQDV